MYSNDDTPLSNKKEVTADISKKMEESHRHYMELKKLNTVKVAGACSKNQDRVYSLSKGREGPTSREISAVSFCWVWKGFCLLVSLGFVVVI